MNFLSVNDAQVDFNHKVLFSWLIIRFFFLIFFELVNFKKHIKKPVSIKSPQIPKLSTPLKYQNIFYRPASDLRKFSAGLNTRL